MKNTYQVSQVSIESVCGFFIFMRSKRYAMGGVSNHP